MRQSGWGGGWAGGRGFGVAAVRFPQAPSRTRRAPFRAPGAPRVFPAGSAAAGGGCWFRGPGGRDVAAAVAVARHGDAGGAGEHDLPLSEPPAFAAEAAFHL